MENNPYILNDSGLDLKTELLWLVFKNIITDIDLDNFKDDILNSLKLEFKKYLSFEFELVIESVTGYSINISITYFDDETNNYKTIGLSK